MTTITTTGQQRRSTEHQHPPCPPTPPRRRVALLDRIALRLGLALITWSRRSRTPETWERRATRIEQQLALEARERATLREALIQSPPR